MHTVNILKQLVENHQTLAYFFIFIALIFEERDMEIAHGERYKEYKRTTPKICPFSLFKSS